MALVKKESLLECEEPWKNDKLGRKDVAQYLTKIIDSIRQPFVISLNSPYGMGKTFFIKNWQSDLLNQGYKAVYFNAWETDYAEDALVAFISSIKEQIEKIANNNTDKENNDRLHKLVGKAYPYLSRNALPALVKILTRLAIGSKLAEDIEDELASLTGDLAKESLQRHEDVKNSIRDFKDFLKTIVIELTDDADHDNKKKLIIFVDELDRCRPHYAIEVLECIKHLFNVDGLVFILAIDEEQIRSSIASVYGLRPSGEGYLNKFIDWQIKLPEPSYHEYTKFLYESFGLDSTGKFQPNLNVFNGKEAFLTSFGLFSEICHLTPRQQAKCFTDINLVVRSLDNGQSPLAHMLAIISVLKTAYGSEIGEYCLGKKPVEELMEKVKALSNNARFKRELGTWEDFKVTFHLWFLDENTLNALESQAASHTIDPEYTAKLRKKWRGYETHINLGTGTIAETVYMRLERASYLNVKGL